MASTRSHPSLHQKATERLDENITKTIQAVGTCFTKLRDHTLGTSGWPIAGRRHELLHWMDLMDLVANALNLKLLDVPEPAVITFCARSTLRRSRTRSTHTPHRDGMAANPTGVAPLPPAVRGSALVVVPSVSYGAGKDYYTVSVNVSSNHCVRSVGLGLLGAYITCQSSNALLTTYSICLHGVAALARIPPTYVQLLPEIHAQHTLARHEFMVKSRCEPAIRSISHHVSQSRRRCPILWLRSQS